MDNRRSLQNRGDARETTAKQLAHKRVRVTSLVIWKRRAFDEV